MGKYTRIQLVAAWFLAACQVSVTVDFIVSGTKTTFTLISICYLLCVISAIVSTIYLFQYQVRKIVFDIKRLQHTLLAAAPIKETKSYFYLQVVQININIYLCLCVCAQTRDKKCYVSCTHDTIIMKISYFLFSTV